MEVIGSQGRLIIHSPFHPGKDTRFQLITDDEEKKLKLPAPGRWLYAGEVEDMAGAVIDGKAPRLSLADSRANMATLLALYESARTGKPVHL
jgi:predicted dehydrogenase